jgi:hypothetical protein
VRRFAGHEFLATTQLEAQVVNDLQSQGLLSPVVEHGSTFFTSIDVEIALRAKILLDQGLEVRHLLPLRRIAVMVGDYVETISRPLDEPPSVKPLAPRSLTRYAVCLTPSSPLRFRSSSSRRRQAPEAV